MRAACEGKWALFDSTDERDHEFARRLCLDCPLAERCVDLAQRTPDAEGTWAGYLLTVRPSRARSHQVAELPSCGTERGYQRHKHYGERCEDCKTAHAAHEREKARQRRAARRAA